MKQNYYASQHIDIKDSELINRETFEYLANYQDVYCITINLPPIFKQEDLAEILSDEFRKQLLKSFYQLEYQGFKESSFKTLIRSLSSLFKDWYDFQYDKALVIYISTEFVKSYYAPIELAYRIYLNDHFYLKAVSQLFNSVAQQLVLHIKDNQVDFFVLRNMKFEKKFEIINSNIVDNNLENYHDLILHQVLHVEEIQKSKPIVPLLVAGERGLVDGFVRKSKNRIQNIEVFYTTKDLSIDELKENVISKLGELIRKQAQLSLKKMELNADFNNDLNIIIKESNNGKIKNLFINKGYEIFGEYDTNNDFVLIGNEHDNFGSLTNLAAIKTVLNNGNVFLLPKEEMPVKESGMNAVSF